MASTTVTIGSNEYRRTPAGRTRLDRRLFSADRPALHVGEQEFRFTRLSPSHAPLPLDGIIEGADWVDDSQTPVLTGTVTLRKPDAPQQSRLRVDDGHQIRCEVLWQGTWREVWTMRVWQPDLTLPDRAWTFQVYDDLYLLQQTRTDLDYKRTKSGPHANGWRADEVVTDLAQRFRFKVGSLVKGSFRIRNLALADNVSIYSAIKSAYQHEADHSGRSFLIRWRNGALHVTTVDDESVPYVFAHQMTNISLRRERKESFATALTMHGKSGSGKKKSKMKVTVVNEAAVKQFGYIHKLKTSTNADNTDELRRQGKRLLAARCYRPRVVSFDHPGVAFLRSGDALQVSVPDEGLVGREGICFARTVSHSLSAGNYTMTVEAAFEPLRTQGGLIQQAEDKKKRATKRATKNAKN